MPASTKELFINDDKDFRYEFQAEYWPHLAVAHLMYNGSNIYSTTLNKLIEPHTDNDRDWEDYEHRLSLWIDEADDRLESAGKKYLEFREF